MSDITVIVEIGVRILLAMAIGGLIGWEREKSNRPAGLRTHMLVTIGAAVIMIIGQLSYMKYAGIASLDPTRLGAQVISGIGFIGAGTILRDGLSVRGLTTAASLWAVACLGLAVGGGFYEVAVIGTIAIILTLTIFDYLESRFRKEKTMRVEITCTDASSTLIDIKELVLSYKGSLKDIDIYEEDVASCKIYRLTFQIVIEKKHRSIDYTALVAQLSSVPHVISVKTEEF